jgi:hypothetical protein
MAPKEKKPNEKFTSIPSDGGTYKEISVSPKRRTVTYEQ